MNFKLLKVCVCLEGFVFLKRAIFLFVFGKLSIFFLFIIEFCTISSTLAICNQIRKKNPCTHTNYLGWLLSCEFLTYGVPSATQSFGQMLAKVYNPQIGELLAVRPLKEMLSGLISAFFPIRIQICDIKNK